MSKNSEEDISLPSLEELTSFFEGSNPKKQNNTSTVNEKHKVLDTQDPEFFFGDDDDEEELLITKINRNENTAVEESHKAEVDRYDELTRGSIREQFNVDENDLGEDAPGEWEWDETADDNQIIDEFLQDGAENLDVEAILTEDTPDDIHEDDLEINELLNESINDPTDNFEIDRFINELEENDSNDFSIEDSDGDEFDLEELLPDDDEDFSNDEDTDTEELADDDELDSEEEYPEYDENFFDDSDDEEIDGDQVSHEEEIDEEEPIYGDGNDSFVDRLKNFKKQILAELKGEDSPDPEENMKGKELALVDDEDKEIAEVDEEAPNKKLGKIKVPKFISKIFKTLKRLYLSIADFFFSIIEGVLKFLSKLPLIGGLFKYLLKFTKIIRIIVNSIPLMLLIVLIVLVNNVYVPPNTETKLPDDGLVLFNEFKYDKETGVVEGLVTNNGPVIAEVTGVIRVHAINILNPITWVKPTEVDTCVTDLEKVDIDSSMVIKAQCEPKLDGNFLKATGELE